MTPPPPLPPPQTGSTLLSPTLAFSLPDFDLWLVVSFHDLGGEVLQAEGSLQCGPHGTKVGAESGSLQK